MGLSTQHAVTKLAYEKGYTVSYCGENVLNPKGKPLKLHKHIKRGKPYYSFSLRPGKGMSPTRVYAHKLQAYIKFGEDMFQKGYLVRHLNDDSTDNHYENIDIGTSMDNTMDRIANANKDVYCPF